MINGVMTLSGSWDKLRTDPIIRFLIVALSFYAMSTFEGPMLSIKEVNAISHNTDWTVGHVHSGALGWVGMITVGSIYVLLPRLYNKARMYSINLITVHFWLATTGTVLYIVALWISGITQGLMWRSTNPIDGTLNYDFISSVAVSHIPFVVRALGGFLYVTGMIVMAYNCYKTIKMPSTLGEIADGTGSNAAVVNA